jgi:hypothetical protein
LGVLVWLLAPRPVGAQAMTDKARVRALLEAVEIDLRAIRDGEEPIEDVQRQAVEARDYLQQLPLLMGSQPAHIEPLLVSLKENAARLVAQAESQDRFTCASVADDLLRDLERLRTAIGLTP